MASSKTGCFRLEYDSMGELKVPADALWGAQTQRAVQNFPVSGTPMPREFIRALGLIKAAAAEVNGALGLLGIFMAGYHIELLFSIPLWGVLFTWYFRVGMKPNSPAQHPENLFRENYFIAYLVFIVIVTRLLSTIELPWLR